MTNEERNRAQDILDNLLRDEYMRGFQDCLVSSLSKSESESLNEEMFAIIKSLVMNRRVIGDPHFEGIRERLIDMAETIVNKVEGEKE
jgi:hypothetical protein